MTKREWKRMKAGGNTTRGRQGVGRLLVGFTDGSKMIERSVGYNQRVIKLPDGSVLPLRWRGGLAA